MTFDAIAYLLTFEPQAAGECSAAIYVLTHSRALYPHLDREINSRLTQLYLLKREFLFFKPKQ